MNRTIVTTWGLAYMLGWPMLVLAGMPDLRMSDAFKARFDVISFFLVVFLLSAGLVRWVWNSLRRDFPRLPYLSYMRSLGLTTLWALLFILVLTMISGARELLTPGAWKKTGVTYQLAEPDKEPRP